MNLSALVRKNLLHVTCLFVFGALLPNQVSADSLWQRCIALLKRAKQVEEPIPRELMKVPEEPSLSAVYHLGVWNELSGPLSRSSLPQNSPLKERFGVGFFGPEAGRQSIGILYIRGSGTQEIADMSTADWLAWFNMQNRRVSPVILILSSEVEQLYGAEIAQLIVLELGEKLVELSTILSSDENALRRVEELVSDTGRVVNLMRSQMSGKTFPDFLQEHYPQHLTETGELKPIPNEIGRYVADPRFDVNEGRFIIEEP